MSKNEKLFSLQVLYSECCQWMACAHRCSPIWLSLYDFRKRILFSNTLPKKTLLWQIMVPLQARWKRRGETSVKISRGLPGVHLLWVFSYSFYRGGCWNLIGCVDGPTHADMCEMVQHVILIKRTIVCIPEAIAGVKGHKELACVRR